MSRTLTGTASQLVVVPPETRDAEMRAEKGDAPFVGIAPVGAGDGDAGLAPIALWPAGGTLTAAGAPVLIPQSWGFSFAAPGARGRRRGPTLLQFGPSNFVSGEASLAITYPSAAQKHVKAVNTQGTGDRFVFLSLEVPPGWLVTAVRVSYGCTNPLSYIRATSLELFQTPTPVIQQVHNDPTALRSPDAVYVSPVTTPFRLADAGESLRLRLTLSFAGTGDAHRIELGAIVLEVVPTDTIDVMAFGARGDGRYLQNASMAVGFELKASSPFSQLDRGKSVMVPGAGVGGADLFANIVSIDALDPTKATLTLAASTPTPAGGVLAFVGTDDTLSIQAAIAAVELGGCLFFPRGTYVISETLLIRRVQGVNIRGAGRSDSRKQLGTLIVWMGQNSTRPIIRLDEASFCRMEDLSVLAFSDADIGIDLTVTNAFGGVSQHSILTNIEVAGRPDFGPPQVAPTLNIAVMVGPPGAPNQSVDHCVLQQMWLAHCVTGILQRYGQTANTDYRDIIIKNAFNHGLWVTGGDVKTHNLVFQSYEDSAAIADVRIEGAVSFCCFINNDHETRKGNAYLVFPAAGGASAITLVNCRVLWLQESGRIVDFQQARSLTMIGCKFGCGEAPPPELQGDIYIKMPDFASKFPVVLNGNQYDLAHITRTIDTAADSRCFVVASDHFFGPALNALGAFYCYRAAVVLDDGSVVFRERAGTERFRLALSGGTTWRLDDSGGTAILDAQTGAVTVHGAASLPEMSADPGAGTNTGKLYTKDVAGVTHLFFQRSDGSVVQLS